jgi:MoxR-like ATPase
MARLEDTDLDRYAETAKEIESAVGRRIAGQPDLIRQTLIGLLAEGHVLLEGVPGLGKTELVKAFAEAVDVGFSRVQFTPDLMPADIVGTQVLKEDETGHRTFEYQAGPVFTNLLLADEINRATPKTQAALLEAMQERHVTVAGQTRPLPRPFLVLATQNPIELEGTYPCPRPSSTASCSR